MSEDKMIEDIFIGSRALSHEQVKLIVPTYDSIVDQIEEIRKQANKENDANKSKNSVGNYQNKQYNNTIGIFGERGTGKTSFLYTIMKQLQGNEEKNNEKCNGNIILPIIEPDNFSENSKILGAILGVLRKEVNQIHEMFKNSDLDKEKFSDFFSECRFKTNNSLNIKYNELLEYYCYRESEYRKLLTRSYTDMETYKKKYSYILNPDLEFANKMRDFIDELISFKRKCSKEEPLIFLFIDDIDLKTSKCKELIESVMQYTCHPNVICVLSGDYEILKESITLSLLENEKLASTYLKDNEIFDSEYTLLTRKKYLANEYLKKIIPPAFRHNVIKWNLDNIPKFSFENKREGGLIHLYEKLNEVFEEENIFCYEIDNEKDVNKDNKKNVIIPKAPYNIFDTTPRGLVNVYYCLSKFDMKKLHENAAKRYIYTKSFIDTLISSSAFLVPHQDVILKKYILWGNKENNTIVNFKEIENELIREEKEEKSEKEVQENIKRFLNYFLLEYCVKKLLPDVVSIGYEERKQSFMYILYKNPWFSEKNVNIKSFISWEEFKDNNQYIYTEGKIYNAAISDFFRNTNLEFSLVFYEELRNRFGSEDIYVDVRKNNDIQIYNEKAFNAAYNILFMQKEKALNIVEEWYRMGYEVKGKMKKAIEFLDKISRQIKGYEVVIEIFKPLQIKCLDEKIYISYGEEIQMMQSAEQRIIKEKTKSINNVYNGYLRDLFINRFSKIVEGEDKDHEFLNDKNMLKNANTYEYRYYVKRKKFHRILKQIQNDKYKNSRDKIEKYINQSMGEIGKYIQKLVCELINNKQKKYNEYNTDKVYMIEIKNIKEKIYEFYVKDKDGSSGTVYEKTYFFIKQVIYNKECVNVVQYIKIIDKLNYLAYRTNAWYGVSEARDLLTFIKNNSQLILPDEFNDSIAPILYQYSRYRKKIDITIIKEDELQNKKDEIRKLLEKAFETLKNQEQVELKELGLELEDTEEDL